MTVLHNPPAPQELALLLRAFRALSWLESRGRVKARQFGDAADNWKWSRKDGCSLLDAIESTITEESHAEAR